MRRRLAAVTASLLAAGLAMAGIAGVPVLATSVPDATAAPGTPGVPQPSTQLYFEDFQNRPGATPIVRLNGYTGASGMTYAANAAWLSNCNGWVANGQQPVASAAQIADCGNSQQSWNSTQQLAVALGQLAGSATPQTNFAVSAFTSANPGANLVEFQTGSQIPIPATGRYIVFSVDVAAVNCSVSAPQLRFELVSATGTTLPAGAAANACVGTSTVNAPAVGVAGARPINVGTFDSTGSVLVNSSSIGVRMINANGSGVGNDHAFDNIRILDGTPQLDKDFADPTIILGETTNLVFTITNTAELAAKNGWSFTDSLSGATVAGAATSTCSGGTVTAPVGGASVSVSGNLALDQASCTVTVPVTATGTGQLSNGPANVTVNGLNPPDTAVVDVEPRVPAAPEADQGQTQQDVPVTIDVLADDVAGSYPLDPTTLQLVGTDGTLTSSLTTPEGQFDVVDGEIVFTPAPGYVGTTPPVTYSVADTGPTPERATSQLTVAVLQPPTARDDAGATPINTAVTVDVLANDTTVTGRTIDATSVVLPAEGQAAGAIVAADGRSMAIPDVGDVVVDPATGAITFTPVAGYSGPVPPIVYEVADSAGTTDTAQLALEVGPPPIGVPDTATTAAGVPSAPIDVVGNDVFDADDPAVPGSVVFPTDGQPDGAVVSEDGTILVLDGVGSFTVADDGTIVFEPEEGYSGDVPPVTYEVSTESGATTTSTLAVTVLEPVVANDDIGETPAGAPTTIAVLGNDTADAATPLDSGSVLFPTDGQPDGATVSEDGLTLTVPSEGAYAIDPATGSVTFSPEPTFTGPASPVTYSVADGSGITDTATIAIEVGPLPLATDDTGAGTQGQPVQVDVVANDGTPGAPAIDAASVVFPEDGQPEGATVSEDGRTLTVPGVGAYVADPTTGIVTFTPEDAFTGAAPAVTYQVSDVNGAVATAEIAIDVASAPVAEPDTARAPFGQSTDPIDLLANDGTDPDEDLDLASVVFPTEGQPEGAAVSEDGKTLTIEGQGTFVIDVIDGTVVFTPEPGFTGPVAPVSYAVTDTAGGTATSTLTVTVGAAPVARDDDAGTLPGESVEIPVLGNDASDPDTELDPTTVAFPVEGQPDGATVSDDGLTLAVPDEGEYVIDPDTGVVTFTPVDGFEGPATPVVYEVADLEGNVAQAAIAVTVAVSPVLADDLVATDYDTPVTIDVLANDAGDGIDAASVSFPVDGQPDGATVSEDGRTLTVPGEGVYVVGDDGQITFTPDATFSGATTTPVRYQATDANGLVASAAITVDVGAGPAAASTPDAVTGPAGQPVVIDVLANDRPSPGADWVPTSVVFPTTGQPVGATVSADGRTLTVPGEGVYVIGEDGRITFTPEAGFSGATTPIAYQVTDTEGVTVTGSATVTIESEAPAPTVPPSTPPGSGGGLPQTGSEASLAALVLAMLLTVVGAGLAVRARRRTVR